MSLCCNDHLIERISLLFLVVPWLVVSPLGCVDYFIGHVLTKYIVRRTSFVFVLCCGVSVKQVGEEKVSGPSGK